MFDALGDFTLVILSIAAVVSIVLSTATASDEDRSHAWVEGNQFNIILKDLRSLWQSWLVQELQRQMIIKKKDNFKN